MVVLLAAGQAAARDTSPDAFDADRLGPAALVARLGHDSPLHRETARHQLHVRGAGAVPALVEGLKHEDYEVRASCRDLLLRIGPAAASLVRPLIRPHLPSPTRQMARRLLLRWQSRSWIGIGIEDLRPKDPRMRTLDLPHRDGVLVANVREDTPGQRAGLQRHDFIVAFDGVEVRSVQELILAVGTTPPDRPCAVRLFRDGRYQSISLTLERMPVQNLTGRAPPRIPQRLMPAAPRKKQR